MRIALRLRLTFLSVVIGTGMVTEAQQPQVPFPEGQLIVNALKEPDEVREGELHEALSELLIEGDATTRSLALPFLFKLARWYDFQGQEDVFKRVADVYGDKGFLLMLDIQQLGLAPQNDQIAVLKGALETGGAEFSHGGVLNRLSAIKWVARTGIVQLEPLVEGVYSYLTVGEKSLYPIERFRIEMNLTRGSADREDALMNAASRLPAAVLASSGGDHPEFGPIAYEYATEACTINPVGGALSTTCEAFSEALKQIEVAEQSGEVPPDWVAGVRDLIDVAEKSRPVTKPPSVPDR